MVDTCLSSGNNNTLCATETLTNIQNSVGTLSKSGVESLVNQLSNGQIPNVPSSALCTDCNKESFNIIKADFPDLVSSQVVSEVSGECGATFVGKPLMTLH